MIFTRNLLNLIESYKKTLSESDFQSFNNHVGRLVASYIAVLSKIESPLDRGRKVHEYVEFEISKNDHTPITCHKGCAACCHLEVEITSDDAAVLKEALLNGIEIDYNKLSQIASRSKHDPLWNKGVVSENRCVFLGDDKACRIYEHRPSSCRKLSVVSDPKLCEDMNSSPVPRTFPMVEIILSAAMSLDNMTSGPMAKMLLELLLESQAPAPKLPFVSRS